MEELQAQIRRNGVKSALLLAGFPLVLPFLISAVVFATLIISEERNAGAYAAQTFMVTLLLMVIATLIWLPIGYSLSQWIIDQATGARLLDRREEPRLWQLLEALCRRAGMRMPALRIIETEAMNAFASGLGETSYSVTVTRGLINELDEAELEAVLAHEITHIRNRDCRLLVVATILVGMIPLVHDIVLKMYWGLMMGIMKLYEAIFSILNFPLARLAVRVVYSLAFLAGKAFGYALATGGYVCSLIIHFAISRRREFMADAGAVELTGNPGAMISALERISCNSAVEATITGVQAMMFESSLLSGWGGLFDTHPPVASRIAAIRRLGAEGSTPRRRREEPRGKTSSIRTRKIDEAEALKGFQRLLSHSTQPGFTDRETCDTVYSRARQSLGAMLSNHDPQLSPSERARLQQALEKAIALNEQRMRNTKSGQHQRREPKLF